MKTDPRDESRFFQTAASPGLYFAILWRHIVRSANVYVSAHYIIVSVAETAGLLYVPRTVEVTTYRINRNGYQGSAGNSIFSATHAR